MKNLVPALMIAVLSLLYSNAPAQDGPPPPPPGGTNMTGGKGVSNNQGPTSAPVGGGMGLLIAFGSFYAGKKVYAAASKRK